MNHECLTPPPINFNCWKHHAGFITERINSVRQFGDIEKLQKCLLRIGESQMDLYLGKHTIEEIAEQLIEHLHQNKIHSLVEYQSWLSKDNKYYRLVKLKDKSIWTLRLSESGEKYVHIHPGRYSPHTVRVKAATLKTAILSLALLRLKALTVIDTESVNDIRKKYLNEPPLKSISKASGLLRLLTHFEDFYKVNFV